MNINSSFTKYEEVRKGFYTIKEAAFYLGVSEKSVRRLIDRGYFNPSVALRKKLIPRHELESFHEKTCLKPEDKNKTDKTILTSEELELLETLSSEADSLDRKTRRLVKLQCESKKSHKEGQ